MSNLALMSQALDFIEDHLQATIAVTDVAEAVSYSLYHFCRIFNQVTHHTPYDYLMRRRLSEAARALLQTEHKIIEIALDYQFNNPATFSRAFRRVFGTQPSQWRQRGRIDRRRLMPRLTRAHLQHLNQAPYLKPVLVERAAFQVAGMMTLVKDEGQDVPALWRAFGRELERDERARAPRDCYGIAYHPDDGEQAGFFYMAAVELPGPHGVSLAWAVKQMPAMKCARFVHKGPPRTLPLTLDYVYHTWLPKSEASLSHPLLIEGYGPRLRGAGDEIMIYLPIR